MKKEIKGTYWYMDKSFVQKSKNEENTKQIIFCWCSLYVILQLFFFVYNKLNRQFVGGIQTQNFVQVNESFSPL